MAKIDADNRAAVISLFSVEGIGPVTVKRLIDSFGKLENLTLLREEEISVRAEINRDVAGSIKAAVSNLKEARREIEKIKRSGYNLYFYGEEEYPLLLAEIYDPPPVLYCWGNLEKYDYNSIAVVGTRKASGYGRTVSSAISAFLSKRKISVVSGAAAGIDTSAHKAVLEAGGRTIAVLGGGFNRPYPSFNAGLLKKIAYSGAVISEFPPDEKPFRSNFPRRNRVISGLSHGVVIIEAPRRSGALITASFAAEQGRQVYAVPGSVFSQGSRGCLDLIKDGAVPVSGGAEIVEDLKCQMDTNMLTRADLRRESKELSDTSRKILNFLSFSPSRVDIMKNKLKMDISFLASELTSLELKGKVKRIDGDKYIKLNDE